MHIIDAMKLALEALYSGDVFEQAWAKASLIKAIHQAESQTVEPAGWLVEQYFAAQGSCEISIFTDNEKMERHLNPPSYWSRHSAPPRTQITELKALPAAARFRLIDSYAECTWENTLLGVGLHYMMQQVLHVEMPLTHPQSWEVEFLFTHPAPVTLDENFRQQLGEILCEVLTPDTDWDDAQEVDRVIVALTPFLRLTSDPAKPTGEREELILRLLDFQTLPTLEERKSISDMLEADAQRIIELEALSVTNIMLDVVPGDGSGYEVYAKSVSDVENTLTKMGSQLEDYQSECAQLRAKLKARNE
jgi:hypothetical protein